MGKRGKCGEKNYSEHVEREENKCAFLAEKIRKTWQKMGNQQICFDET